ncbi:MAG: substrate-binding domain-containing protein [Methylocystis sp.]|nr:substrate-binding domain-containing protein [Methylocystis sp.]MCA3583608.1 substrate-binding domain-containing protein [Methylocystis sp.]MCA3586544.1 substrate-binding domain-containing protein [Methylocystis sp.]MCA3593305.1 substrate-binding domain-containing protein [Methylocystis sp.]
MNKTFLLAGLCAAALATGGTAASARDQIRIVGSSTVYPFTTAVAEQFGKAGNKAPVVESTGTGGGMKLFCAGVGAQHPDASNASRRITKREFEDCKTNGVTDVIETKIGFDGLTVANSKSGPDLKLTKEQIFLALAKNVPNAEGKLVPNPYKNWSDINAALPNIKIEVLGPPPSSGTRDSFHELVMEPGAEAIPALKALKAADRKAFDTAWKQLREDGGYVEAGENDNLIVQKLVANPASVGVFGFSFLEENTAKIKGATINGISPTFENIASGTYTVARPLFIYFKKQHVGVIPGLDKFMVEFVSDRAIGEDGYLSRKGLVALPKADVAKVRADIQAQRILTSEAGL